MLGGRLDLPLTAEGRREAEALGRRLRDVRIDRIVSSPMRRSLETAQFVADGRPIEIEERLREINYGRWEGMTYAQIYAADPNLRPLWERDPAHTHSPGGECGEDVATRARSVLMDLLARERGAVGNTAADCACDSRASGGEVAPDHAEPAGALDPSADEGESRVLLVGHGTFNRILMCVALAAPVRDYRHRFLQERTNLTVLRYEPDDGLSEARLVLANDIAHLRTASEAPWAKPGSRSGGSTPIPTAPLASPSL
jgi:broad specificity phosphatase PhoE